MNNNSKKVLMERGAIRSALNELGVPDESYPASVANAVEILTLALENAAEQGAGLDVERLARAWYEAVEGPEEGPWEHAPEASIDNAKAWAIDLAERYAALVSLETPE